jgi:threonine/homoserine/homoserine lactone efflux protein
MNAHLLIWFLAVLAVALLIPGPDMLFIVATSARGGTRAGLLATLGVMTGQSIQMGAVVAGLAALFAAVPTAFLVVRLCGAAYLLYLGIQAFRNARRGSPLADAGDGESGVSWGYAYLRGLLTNMANPKSVTFFVALLPQFVDRSLGHVTLQFAVLGVIVIALGSIFESAVAVMAGRFGSWLKRRRRARQALDIGAGTVMIALAARLATER